ncbi:MAG: hypothetical protein CL743_01835 [Chloroflexi bacterium]|nr:hypothetical protein [Chloroflexota bacterium]|tara:strand:- start:5128 stop:5973 length:846 start_codon:yes stop_codon:yes gene_type:complete
MIISPLVSIIIRTYNEAEYIETLLKAIRSQTITNTEIILVDSESTDNTVALAAKYCDQIVRIKKTEFTFGYSLNKGIEIAKGEILILVSAHTKPLHNQWIENLINPLQDPNIAMVYGKQVGDSDSRYSEYKDLIRIFPDKAKLHTDSNYFSHNANSCLRKKDWLAHKFDETLTGQEDIEWARYWMQNGFSVFYEPSSPIIHSHYENNQQIRHRFKRESFAMKNLGLINYSAIPKLLAREIFSGIVDILQMNSNKNHKNKLLDVLIYRYSKISGTIAGMYSK